jgi:DNA-binding GntR family transcriptional regulator
MASRDAPGDRDSDQVNADDFDLPLRAVSLADRAYRRIEAIILSGKVKGGERLIDAKLAKALSVSRGPVRNALARLAEAGLVETVPYRGTFVRTIDYDDVMEIYEVRAAVERAGVMAASRNMTPDVLARLKQLALRMDDSFRRGDTEHYFKINLAFH